MLKTAAILAAVMAVWVAPAALQPAAAQSTANRVIMGPNVGPSPYAVIRGWLKPFAKPGFAFGGNSGVWAESPNRIFIAQRGETRLPQPVPPAFAGFAGSIGINVLNDTQYRTWQHCLYTVDGNGRVKEIWDQWDKLCAGSDGPGPHRIRINPYDPEHRVWVVNETFDVIYVFSNDGKRLEMTLGEKGVPGDDGAHFGRPQDVAFLPDGRILVADGLDNHRVMILDKNAKYLGEFGGHGTAPGQFNGVHAVATGPNGLIFALDRSGGRVNVFRTTSDPAKVEHVATWDGFSLPLDLIVNDNAVWLTDLNPLRFVKLDFGGNRLYTWLVPRELPDGYLEVHTFSVDSDLNLYGGDNQYGRTQKFVPKPDADPALIIHPPWHAPLAAGADAAAQDTGIHVRAVRVLASDPLAIAGFYEKTFGMSETRRPPVAGRSIEIVLNSGPTSAAARQAATTPIVVMTRPANTPAGAMASLILDVPDLDKAIASVTGNGGTLMRPPAVSGEGLHYAFVKDPDGNQIELVMEPR